MPALDLALGHRMIRRAADVLHVLAVEPFGQVRRDVAGAVVGDRRAFNDAKTKLKLVAGRRNAAIVHKSDMYPLTNAKTPITASECEDVTDFLQLCGRTIAKLVI
jgi:hypothetical protein